MKRKPSPCSGAETDPIEGTTRAPWCSRESQAGLPAIPTNPRRSPAQRNPHPRAAVVGLRTFRALLMPVIALLLTVPPPSVMAKGANLALGKPVSASGSYGIYGPGRGNDGDPSSIWNGGSHQACWMVDLQGVYSIQAVVVSSNQFGDSGLQTVFQISSSLGDGRWLPVGPMVTGRGDQTFTIAAGGAPMRLLRYCTVPGSTQWATLGELQVYGTSPTQASQNPGNRNVVPCDPSTNTRSPFDEGNCYRPEDIKTVPSSR